MARLAILGPHAFAFSRRFAFNGGDRLGTRHGGLAGGALFAHLARTARRTWAALGAFADSSFGRSGRRWRDGLGSAGCGSRCGSWRRSRRSSSGRRGRYRCGSGWLGGSWLGGSWFGSGWLCSGWLCSGWLGGSWHGGRRRFRRSSVGLGGWLGAWLLDGRFGRRGGDRCLGGRCGSLGYRLRFALGLGRDGFACGGNGRVVGFDLGFGAAFRLGDHFGGNCAAD
ncbi:MAG: hypothetical protein V4578_19575 [Pseudomonadota bacterium]